MKTQHVTTTSNTPRQSIPQQLLAQYDEFAQQLPQITTYLSTKDGCKIMLDIAV